MKKYIVPELVHSVYEEKTELCTTIFSTGDETGYEFWAGGNDPNDID